MAQNQNKLSLNKSKPKYMLFMIYNMVDEIKPHIIGITE